MSPRSWRCGERIGLGGEAVEYPGAPRRPRLDDSRIAQNGEVS